MLLWRKKTDKGRMTLGKVLKMMRENPEKEQLLVVNLSGRGDKDIFTVHDILKARGEI